MAGSTLPLPRVGMGEQLPHRARASRRGSQHPARRQDGPAMMADTIDRADAMYARTIRGARELAREWAQTDTRMTRVWTAADMTDTYKQEEN